MCTHGNETSVHARDLVYPENYISPLIVKKEKALPDPYLLNFNIGRYKARQDSPKKNFPFTEEKCC